MSETRRTSVIAALCIAVLAPAVLLSGAQLAGSAGLAAEPHNSRIKLPQITLRVVKHGFITESIAHPSACLDEFQGGPGAMCVEVKAVLQLNGYVLEYPFEATFTRDFTTGNASAAVSDTGEGCGDEISPTPSVLKSNCYVMIGGDSQTTFEPTGGSTNITAEFELPDGTNVWRSVHVAVRPTGAMSTKYATTRSSFTLRAGARQPTSVVIGSFCGTNTSYDPNPCANGDTMALEATVSVAHYPSVSPEAGTVTFTDQLGKFICSANVNDLGEAVCGTTSPGPFSVDPINVSYSGTQTGLDDGYGTSYAPSSGMESL